jgi:hypothetical protein
MIYFPLPHLGKANFPIFSPENPKTCAELVENTIQDKTFIPKGHEVSLYTGCKDHHSFSSWINILSLTFNANGIFSPTPSPNVNFSYFGFRKSENLHKTCRNYR